MSTHIGNNLIERLKKYQSQLGLSNYKFAERLGISAELWRMMKLGKRAVSLSLLRGIMKAYPEMEEDVLIFLRGDVADTTSNAVFRFEHIVQTLRKKLARVTKP